MSAYYNENDPFAAAWLRELIRDGLIAPGIVDTRSIEDVVPTDLKGFTQCHFFAGIGVWSLALRVAGWPDDRPIWTGSCPCQPFSAAGKGDGFADERHLWPAWFHLIQSGKRRDVPVVGEQVAAKAGRAWFDLVSGDMEALDHACGAVDISAAGFGAPFIGQRLYWLAATNDARLERHGRSRQFDAASGRQVATRHSAATGALRGLAASDSERCAEHAQLRQETTRRFESASAKIGRHEQTGGLAASDSGQCEQQSGERRSGGLLRTSHGSTEQQQRFSDCGSGVSGLASTASGQSGHGDIQPSGQHGLIAQDSGDCDDGGIPLHPVDYWRDADWLLCRDPNGARFRPVERGTFPLVDARTVRNRLGQVRGAGNALNIAQAASFVEAVMGHLDQ